MTSVPISFISHLLAKVESATVNSIKMVKHMKPPVWTDSCPKISYKTYCFEDVVYAFNEQRHVPLKVQRSYSGNREVPETRELFGREALEAAKKRTTPSPRATMKTELIISEGTGRATRECEFIWWPLYQSSKNGNLTVRLFIGKVDI